MSGAGVVVGLDPRRDRIRVAPGHHRVEEPRGPVFDFVFEESEAFPVVSVVGEIRVDSELLPGDLVGDLSVGGEHTLLLHTQERIGAHHFASDGGVFGGGPVGVGPGRLFRGECQHLGAERRQHREGLLGRSRGQVERRVHRLDVGAHRAERLVVGEVAEPLDHWCMRHPEPEQEPPA